MVSENEKLFSGDVPYIILWYNALHWLIATIQVWCHENGLPPSVTIMV